MDESHSATRIRGFESHCPVCLEEWGAIDVVPWVFSCGHMICEKCLSKHKLNTRKCHICREKFIITCKRREREKENRLQRNKQLREKIEEDLELLLTSSAEAELLLTSSAEAELLLTSSAEAELLLASSAEAELLLTSSAEADLLREASVIEES